MLRPFLFASHGKNVLFSIFYFFFLKKYRLNCVLIVIVIVISAFLVSFSFLTFHFWHFTQLIGLIFAQRMTRLNEPDGASFRYFLLSVCS